jgi:16S rRNA (adenine1518-N6/adenine1519-N6)-dimethyltransferase
VADAPRSRPRRSLGQHFLSDENILRRIVAALEPTPGDVVLEIGPGQGTLTRELLGRDLRVIAIEKDRRLAHECGMRNAERGVERLKVVEGDALKLNWHALLDAPHAIPHSAFRIPHFKVVGNIPYYITTPLIDKALTPPLPERVVFLVQEEVADRIVAAPGSKTYGALSVGVQVVARAEKLFTIKPGSFRPPPRVHSAVVRLRPLLEPLVDQEEVPRLRQFVTACFGLRRKQLHNVLRTVTGRSAAIVAAGLAALGLDPQARPEALPPEDFVRLLRWA